MQTAQYTRSAPVAVIADGNYTGVTPCTVKVDLRLKDVNK